MQPRSVVVIGLVVIVAIVAAALYFGRAGLPGGLSRLPLPLTSPSVSVPPSPSTSAALKPELHGLIDFNGEPHGQYVDLMSGWVVQVPWQRLEPSGPGLVANNPIDQAIAKANQLDRSHPGHSYHLKVRVLAGIRSPNWVKVLGGPPVSVTEPGGGHPISGTIPRFWTDAVGRAYDRLMQELAIHYDGSPVVEDVVISRCTTVFAEPMVRQYNNHATVANLLQAGYTSALDNMCQHQEIDEAKVFHHTHVSISISPYERIDAPGGPVIDDPYGISIAEYCRSVLGQQCVLGNNELGRPIFDKSPEAQSPIYQALKRLGPPIYFQVEANTNRISTAEQMEAAIKEGVDFRAAYLEVDKVIQKVPTAQIESDSKALDSD